MINELFITLNDRFFFQRMNSKQGFTGNARIRDFEGRRAMEINADAYSILELLDKGCSVQQTVATLAAKFDMDPQTMGAVVDQVVQSAVRIGLASVSQAPVEDRVSVIPPCFDSGFVSPLKEVFIELLSKCNLECKHCYGSFGPSEGDMLSKEQVFSVLDQLFDMQCPEVKFTGGEPFLHPDFMDILDYAHSKNFTVMVLTNGTLVTPAKVEAIKKMGQTSFHISLDGHEPEIHDNFRGMKGAFQRTLDCIHMLNDAGFGIKVVHSLHRQNSQYLEQMMDFAEEMDLPLTFGQVYRFGRCESNVEDVYLDAASYRDVFRGVRKRMKANGKLKDDYQPSPRPANGFIERCEAGRDKFAVRPNGELTPCISFPHLPQFVFGTLQQGPIVDTFRAYDRHGMLGDVNALSIKKCSQCDIVADCKAGCLAVSFVETGKFDEVDAFTCVKERVMRCNE